MFDEAVMNQNKTKSNVNKTTKWSLSKQDCKRSS